MKTIRLILFVFAAAFTSAAFAARTSSFGIDSFNSAVPMDEKANALFSPIGFEIDCTVFGEAVDTIARAGIAESMGVLTDFSSVYRPIVDRYESLAPTNGFAYLCARGFCLPDERMASADYRRRLWELCGAGVCRLFPSRGAEAWFRARMMGQMEDFEVPVTQNESGKYRYYDLVSVTASLPRRADAVQKRPFNMADGRSTTMDFFRLKGVFRRRSTPKYTLVKIPLCDGAFLYAMLPADGVPLSVVRSALTGDALPSLRTSVDELGVADALPARAEIVFPKLDFKARTDLAAPFLRTKVPQTDFVSLKEDLTHRDAEQIVRFRLEDGATDNAAEQEFASVNLGEIAFDRPFVFFLHRPEDDTTSVVGQFTGL